MSRKRVERPEAGSNAAFEQPMTESEARRDPSEAQMSETLRPASRSAREGVLTALFVLVCFAVFLGVVRLTFPEGTTLRGLVSHSGDLVSGANRTLEGDGLSAREDGIATLTNTIRNVKDRPASAITWSNSRKGRSLGNRHAIQTGAGSSATIQFSSRNSVRLSENSLLVLKSIDVEEDGSDRRATLVMLGGSLDGIINSAGGETMTIAIETPNGTVHLRTGKGAPGKTEFRVNVAEDKTATVSVLSGSVELETEEGSVRIEPLQMVVSREKGFSKPLSLPGVPRAKKPAIDSKWTFRAQPPVIEFRWGPVPSADAYHFILANDRDLQDVVWEKVQDRPWFDHGALRSGNYWWAVAARDNGREGPMTAPQGFALVQDQEPPPLTVDWPDDVRSKSYALAGQTERGASVFVKDQQGAVDDDGSFVIEVSLERGANVVVVESVDSVGNTTYESRIIRTEY